MQGQELKIINIMQNNMLNIKELDSKKVNKDWLIRLDGYKGTLLEIHSAIGYYRAMSYCGKSKFIEILQKAYKKGGDKCKLKANHKLTVTLYAR